MTKEEIIDNIARLNSETWRDREEVRTKIGQLLAELRQALEQSRTRKVGKWIRVDHTKVKCSNCDITHLIAQYPHGVIDYCPNCGSYNQSIIENER